MADVPGIALVDTRASLRLLNGEFYHRLLQAGRCFDEGKSQGKGERLRCANNVAMEISSKVSTSIKLGGVEWPASFVVVEELVHQIILGMGILKDTKAVIHECY